MNAAVVTKSFARAVATARLPTRRPQAAMRAYRTAGLTQEALRSIRHQAAPLAAGGRGSRLQQLRCLASRRDDEPSWSEIASEAGQVAKDLVKKLGSTVGKAANKVAEAIVPSEEKQAPVERRERERQRDVYRPGEDAFGGGLVGGLLGRAVGGMLRSAVGALGEQIRQAQEQVADVQDRAARIIETSSRLRDAMGGSVRAQPPVSQSSMSQNINGRMSKTVTLIMPVVGGSGQMAQAQVQYVEGGSSAEQLTVSVRLPNGQVINLDGGSMAAGKTIDVEWREVDGK